MTTDTMRALVATGYGDPEQLTIAELPVPRPGPGQVLVKIAASTINPTDLRVTTGGYRDLVDLRFPYTLGNEFAGTVTEAGPGVTRFRAGDEIFGQALPRQLRAAADPVRPSLSTGALADYAVFEADTPALHHRPAALDAERAASLVIAGGTTLAVVDAAKIQPGESVLVIGATGPVGLTLVPVLNAAGAEITATARTEEAAELLRGLGAHRTVGYDDYPAGVDVVLNLALFPDGLPAAARSLRPGGRLISIIFPEPRLEQLGRDDVELGFVMNPGNGAHGAQAVAEAAIAGQLSTPIARRYSLDDGVEAAIHYARRHPLGKVVVTM
ncbi:NADP-dependent oxidoreductase [Lentzea albida]|uniref:NADPH:quinone reductase n=1 Tax=Lentzea albida TaxID=65499 RepID=A0A1H9DTP1_9PSEU|nr:NADP-dependent oxidoreductase [Lentzea albida]SEQ16183.1 NADPH:quinone reductase [Lentzea albida]